MHGEDAEVQAAELAHRYRRTRSLTEALAEPLSPEDQTVQSMDDASPTKWHRGHTTWFFETFVLARIQSDAKPFHPGYSYIFNSYYEAIGNRHPRGERGLVTRPGVAEVATYRSHVDRLMEGVFEETLTGHTDVGDILELIELGIHHEQQHQELLLMDAKHVLSRNPLLPAYADLQVRTTGGRAGKAVPSKLGWIEYPGGDISVGHQGDGFSFDNERPHHRAYLEPFAVADRLITCGEWIEFIEDGGYDRPEFWLSDGWAAVREHGWSSPLYWSKAEDGGWTIFTLGGPRPVLPGEPVCHISLYEADAYAHWRGYRLATETEWETVATAGQDDAPLARLLDQSVLHPRPGEENDAGFLGDVWEWTSSSYAPYPGFRPAVGAVGEYNGKFMVNQYVLRGGSCVTPVDHVRLTYRNFFPASARWAFSGVRLARDL